ncbi:hypothetical protein [Kerstersia gyiorum]|uniref:Uncharacterized protein n=1 Tax=Kerstersia gyiorum TaxID=206506 RepID=A0A171KSD7_9BURK|nr:hypothetical protein [Kerstersia gyiorum]KKO71804.1 hypothetical protein AAV32_09505 [Kerstersia gyiorum]
MTYDQTQILTDADIDQLARQVTARDSRTAQQQFGRLVINETLVRLRGRMPASHLDPILTQARAEAFNIVGASLQLRTAFESGARWLLDSGLVTEKEK